MTEDDSHRMGSPPYQGSWYCDINPNEHTYTPGYGFFSRPPAMIERRLIGSYAMAAGICLLGYFLVSSLIPGLLYQLFDHLFPAYLFPTMQELLIQAASGMGSALALVFPFVLYAAFVKIPPRSALPVKRVSSGLMVCAVLIALAVSVVGMYATDALSQTFSRLGLQFAGPQYALPLTPGATVLYIINMTLLPALFEEFAFRGVLMQSLRRFGDGFALLTSSILFALVHVVPIKFPNALLMGLVIGYFVLFTGSIRSGMIIHFIHNALVLCLSGLSYFEGVNYSISVLVVQLCYLTMGLVALLTLLRRYGGLFALCPSTTVNSEGQKLRYFFLAAPVFVLLILVLVMGVSYIAPL